MIFRKVEQHMKLMIIMFLTVFSFSVLSCEKDCDCKGADCAKTCKDHKDNVELHFFG